ncbi:Zinc finger RING/FYVE/PHD-type protein [Dioscorea alata]|uniref:Zinc finger RING/FYVE/PHD-type protein n=1 Tax=Dioscorea alata TaxID=55571 RepID=A0ACB7U6A3_DIOAL|nr:Zinc finger RING/FYVE/PHD-type protein [Dioscorea alata]
MAKTKPGKKDLDSYTIKGTNKVVKVGDCVLMRPADSEKQPYVARVEEIEADHRNNVKVRVRWYYRPEESIGGRRQFHGAKELFLSDHYDVQSEHTIEGKSIVHSFKNYTKLENVGAEDYFCRFEYKAATRGFTPDRVAVYCKCEMPYNPDDLMVQCEGCKDCPNGGRDAAEKEWVVRGRDSGACLSSLYGSTEINGDGGSGSSHRPEFQQKKAKLLVMQEEIGHIFMVVVISLYHIAAVQ